MIRNASIAAFCFVLGTYSAIRPSFKVIYYKRNKKVAFRLSIIAIKLIDKTFNFYDRHFNRYDGTDNSGLKEDLATKVNKTRF